MDRSRAEGGGVSVAKSDGTVDTNVERFHNDYPPKK